MKLLIGCCGLDCERCDAYIATVNNDAAIREKTAKLWSELNNAPITPEMINCLGCRADGVKTPFCDSICGIRKCCFAKGFSTCSECDIADSCETLSAITANNPDALKNLSV